MDLLLRKDLDTLLADRSGTCVSLFLPTERGGPEMRQGPVRLRNLVRQAAQRLEARGFSPEDAEDLLAPALGLAEDPGFWQQAGDGLAVFASTGLFRAFRLPFRFPEKVVVGHRFAIKPLLPALPADGTFHILALSRNEVRLIEAREHTARVLDLPGVPRSLVAALGELEETETLSFHTSSTGSARTSVFHGAGVEEDEKRELARYFRRVDTGLREVLRDRATPLVLAGVDYLLPIYREVSSHPRIVGEIRGNPELLSAEELRDRAWKVVAPLLAEERQQAAARYRELAGTGRASADIREVLPAARTGRVDILFLSRDVDLWDNFATTPHPSLAADERPGDEELLDTAAVFTLRNGGTAYAVDASQVPGGGPVAAVFRY